MDISLGGMYIQAEHALEVGSILRLYIPLGNDGQVLAPIAEVVWAHDKGGGLRFVSLREEEKERLRAFLEDVSFPN